MSRVRFDDLVAELAALGCECWTDLTPANRRRLIRLYFEDYPEWGDALYENMGHVFAALEHHDDADFGLAVRHKLEGYVRPYVERQLGYQAQCRRERDEIEGRLTEIDPDWREHFPDSDQAEQFYAKELSA